jgi:hypothetical protein
MNSEAAYGLSNFRLSDFLERLLKLLRVFRSLKSQRLINEPLVSFGVSVSGFWFRSACSFVSIQMGYPNAYPAHSGGRDNRYHRYYKCGGCSLIRSPGFYCCNLSRGCLAFCCRCGALGGCRGSTRDFNLLRIECLSFALISSRLFLKPLQRDRVRTPGISSHDRYGTLLPFAPFFPVQR